MQSKTPPHGFWQTLKNDAEFQQYAKATNKSHGSKALRIAWVEKKYGCTCGDTLIRKALRGGPTSETSADMSRQRFAAPCEGMKPAPDDTTETSFEEIGDKGILSSKSTRITTLDQLLSYMKVDTSTWSVSRHVLNKWEVGAKNAEGDIVVEPLFQIKIWLEKKVQVVAARGEIGAMIEEAKQYMPRYAPIIRTRKAVPPHLLLPSIYDPHFGKLSWNPETLWGSYDVNIAERIFDEALEDLIQKTSGYEFGQVLFPLGNDLLNSDNQQNTTTAGTPQSTDGRHIRTFTRVRNVAIRAIERLREIAPVHVVMVPGNHDQLSVFHLGSCLEMRMHNCPDVTIDNTPPLRKYYEWGANMWMFTHGDKPKNAQLAEVAAAEQPAMWGRTRFREANVGHLHKTALNETHGFRVRTIPSLTATDSWHAENGFVGNIRSAEAFVWSRENGMVGSAIYNLPKETP